VSVLRLQPLGVAVQTCSSAPKYNIWKVSGMDEDLVLKTSWCKSLESSILSLSANLRV